jgi:peptidoglycan/LPS O-acetylase OafA/YrhL
MMEPSFLAYAIVILALLCCILVAALLVQARFPLPGGQRLQSVDGLRGYLAILVMVHHFVFANNYLVTGEWKIDETGFFHNLGPVAVTLFFFITAFLFYGRAGSASGGLDWLKIYLSRIFRIVPLYLCAVLAMIVIIYSRDGWVPKVPLRQEAASLAHWLAFGLFRFSPINGDAKAFVVTAGVTWTLRYEWAFYVCLPVLGLFVRLLPSRNGRLLALAAAFLCLGFMRLEVLGFRSQPAAAFVIGMIGSELTVFEPLRIRLQGRVAGLIGLICLALALLYPFSWFAPAQVALCFLFFLPALCGNSYFGLLHLSSSRMLGEVSYSLYLMHGIVIYLVLHLVAAAGLSVAGEARWLLLLPISLLTVLLSAATFFAIERPGIAAGRQFGRLISDRAGLSRRFDQQAEGKSGT